MARVARSSWRGVVGLLAVLAVAQPVAAQDRLFVPGSQGTDGVELGAVGHFGEVLGPGRGLARPLVGGGRFAVVGSAVLDLRTGQSRVLPTGAHAVAFDPARPRIFIVTPTAAPSAEAVEMFDVVSGQSSPLVVNGCPTPFGPRRFEVRYAAGAERLFVERCAAVAGQASDVLVFDLAMAPPALVRTLAGSLPVGATMLPSPDGTRLFVGVSSAFGGSGELTALDTASAATVAVVATPLTSLTWDDTRQWLFVATTLSPGFNESVTAWTRDLAPIGVAAFSDVGPCGVRVAVSAHTGRIYVTTGGSDYYGAPPLGVTVFGGTPVALLARAVLPSSATTTCEGAVVRSAPGAPRQFRATVGGGDVTLAWESVGEASNFVLDIGLAPGRTDLSVLLGPDSRASFAAVPPGVYYLRLRGGNEFGGGRPSSEIRVVVP